MIIDLLKARLRREEGFRPLPYCDRCGLFIRKCRCEPGKHGRITIGYGRNLEDVGIQVMEAEALLEADAIQAVVLCRSFVWYGSLCEARQVVIADMCFNLGLRGLQGFKKMLAAVAVGDFDRAADEMLDSAWARQVGSRATRLAAIMRSGVLEEAV